MGPAEVAGLEFESVSFRVRASDGTAFKFECSQRGVRFFTEETSAGNSTGSPVELSIDRLWEIACSEHHGSPPFDERAEVKRSRNR